MNQQTILATILILSAAGYFWLGARLLFSRREIGSVPIGTIFCIVSVWVLGGAIEMLATTHNAFLLGRTAHFVGTALLPVAAFVCFREYTGVRTATHVSVLLLIIPVVSIALAATNSSHAFMWRGPATDAAGAFLTRPDTWGPWFLWVHAPYSYLIVGLALLRLLVHSSVVAPVHRRGLILLAACCTVPLLATLAYDLGYGPHTLSFVPLVLAAMLPVFTWLTVWQQVGEFAPLAYETVFQNMQDPVVVLDDEQRIIGMNRSAEKLLNMSEGDALRMPLESIFGTGSTSVFEVLESGAPKNMVTETGRYLHVQVSPIRSTSRLLRDGKVLMFRDVSDVELAQSEVRKSEMLLRTLVDHSVNGIVRMSWADDGGGKRSLRCIFANAAAGRFLDMDITRLVHRDAQSIIRLASSGMTDEEARPVLERFELALANNTGVDVELRQGTGTTARWLRMICEPVGDDIAATFIDITDTKAKQRQMESIASSDPLTGVLNRRGFEQEATLRLSDSADDAIGALLFIDLNDFKLINDRYGHGVGDQLLTIAARRLQKSLRSCDIIGRPGGDEFVALVPDVSKYMAGKLAARLATSLEAPYIIGGETLQCPASIGLAHYPDNASTLTGLLREADQAMYRAKARSRDHDDLGITTVLEKAL
ncbi:MAG TPA: diguanylate cyclase [Woeseiaceae bacterium]|nr:diguanylate cyclase [Woeseiaceae bacterium]